METVTHEKTPDTHSSIVGGSSASRILGCPGSVDLLARIPESILRESSSYADEGTGLHEIMAYLVEHDEIGEHDIINDPKVDELWQRYKLHDDRLWDAVLPAWRAFNTYCDALLDGQPEDAELRIRVESRVQMPGIDGAFGTCDVLIRAPGKTVVWDWKFGQGVPVLASYKRTTYVQVNAQIGNDGTPNEPELEPEEEEFGNDQLMFYARAAAESYPDYFDEPASSDWPVELVICQPRIMEEDLSRFTTDMAELDGFRLDLVDAVEEALSGSGRRAKGSYCRFAKCKAICPLHLNGAEAMAHVGSQLAKLQMLHAAGEPASLEGSNFPSPGQPGYVQNHLTYPEAIGLALDLRDVLEPYFAEAENQAHALIEAGIEVPGRKAVPKKAGWDGWEDEKKTDAFLGRQGLGVEDRRKPWSSITPAVARKKLKALGHDEKQLKLLEKYVKPGVSSGTTIARSDDPREAVLSTPAAVKALADKIASLGT